MGFATFENVRLLTSCSTGELLCLGHPGFGYRVHARRMALGLGFLWDEVWVRVVGGFGLLCPVLTFRAVLNVFVNQIGPSFWIGSATPLVMMLVHLLVLQGRRAALNQ